MNTSSNTKKVRLTSSENFKHTSQPEDKLIEIEQQVQKEIIQKLMKNQQRVEELQEKLTKLREEKAKKTHELDSIQVEIRECKEHKEILPLIQQLREHYKKLKEQLGSGLYYQEDDLDVDEMSYEQLLELGEKIGKVSKGLSEGQFQKLEKVICSADEQCSICQDTLIIGSECIKLKCGHLYDTECLKEWFKMEKICPLCKSESI